MGKFILLIAIVFCFFACRPTGTGDGRESETSGTSTGSEGTTTDSRIHNENKTIHADTVKRDNTIAKPKRRQ